MAALFQWVLHHPRYGVVAVAILVEMAVVQNTQGKVAAALSDYTQALQLQRDIGMKKEVGDTLIDMGVVYESKGDYDKALQNYKESLQIQRDTIDAVQIVMATIETIRPSADAKQITLKLESDRPLPARPSVPRLCTKPAMAF